MISPLRRDLLMALHMAVGGVDARAVVRAWVDGLTGEWGALRDRTRASTDRRDAIDDAIAWTACYIAGPTLVRATDSGEETDRELITARALIVLGRIQDAADNAGLTIAETVAWSESAEASPPKWLLARHGLAGCVTESVAVARWAIDQQARDPDALRKPRSFGGVDGSALARLAELKPCDLQPSVVDTLEVSTRRMIRDRWDGPDELAKPAPWESRLPDGCERVRHFARLFGEGSALRHCVGLDPQYARGIMQREHEIISLLVDGERYTAQVRRGGVVECRGRANAIAPARVMDLAAKCAKVAS
jgi:hypothetical protein